MSQGTDKEIRSDESELGISDENFCDDMNDDEVSRPAGKKILPSPKIEQFNLNDCILVVLIR